MTSTAGDVDRALRWVSIGYLVFVAALGIPAVWTVSLSTSIGTGTKTLGIVTIVTTGIGVFLSARARNYSLAQNVFWVWSFLFMGLASAYQSSALSFPWRGEFTEASLSAAYGVVLVGCAAAAFGSWAVGRARRAHAIGAIGFEPTPRGHRALRNSAMSLLGLYILCAALYIAITGPGLFGGKAALQEQLVANSAIAGSGTLFFVSTAGAMLFPALAIVLRRNGVRVPIWLIAGATLLAAIVTNPLTGSRFLTGTFLFSVAGALLVRTVWQRLLPAGIAVVLVTIFPTLDILRGDGTESPAVSALLPSQSLIGFDFDAFEMLARAISVSAEIGESTPGPLLLLIAPLVRWVPGLSNFVQGNATGPAVAELTGMTYTNVSMPLWGEGFVVGGVLGVVIYFLLLGALIGCMSVVRRRVVRMAPTSQVIDPTAAALLFIVLRGSLYEVLGYLLLAVTVGAILYASSRFGVSPSRELDSDSPRPRTVAYYLPQFHAIPENDEWWGKGFTEWVNVRRATPKFRGDDHPRRAGELGEYDLSDVKVMHQQAQMAKENGVDAFCFYFYWFGGERLLERPVEQYLAEGPDFPFCLSWANESWSRRWDGKEHESLITQKYGNSTAAEIFEDFLPYLRDARYLRVDSAAVILVHRIDQIPGGDEYATTWRRLADEAGVGPLRLIASETHPGVTPSPHGFDAVSEFPPVGSNTLASALLMPPRDLVRSFTGRLMSFRRMAQRFRRRDIPAFARHRAVAPGWDNSARRGDAATIYVGSTPHEYHDWLTHARLFEQRLRGENGLVFVNAWNEWAEGAYLEPDASSGRSYLHATRWGAVPGRTDRARLPIGFPSQSWFRSLALASAGSVLQAARQARSLLKSATSGRGRR